jgi:hypothetical protein
MTKCKQYSIFFQGMPVEYTGYFKSLSEVRKYIKSRYPSNISDITFRAVYPNVEEKIYAVA